LGSQIDGLVLLDETGRPIRPAIIWMDRRAGAQCSHIRSLVPDDELFNVTGLCIDPSHVAAKIHWVRDNEPSNYSKAKRFLLPGDYGLFHLTGIAMTDYSNASSTMLLDIKERKWSKKLCNLLEIPSEMLPDVAPATKVAGTLRKDVAERMGLDTSVKVVVGGGDEEVGAVGAGVVNHGQVLDLTGTAEPVCICIDKPIFDPKRLLECHANADPESWLLENTGIVAGGLYRWFGDQFGQIEVEAARKAGVDPYEILNMEASKAEPGSMALICLPFFTGSITPEWNADARGVFFGVTLGHRKEHFIRSILEGCAYVVRDVVDHAERLGLNVERVTTAGGGARGTLWRQIKADVTNKETVKPSIEEVTAFGAVLLADVGVGVHRDVRSAVKETIELCDELQPSDASHARYNRLYKTYLKLYYALKDVFPHIASYQEQ
jgi:xylulokinase